MCKFRPFVHNSNGTRSLRSVTTTTTTSTTSVSCQGWRQVTESVTTVSSAHPSPRLHDCVSWEWDVFPRSSHFLKMSVGCHRLHLRVMAGKSCVSIQSEQLILHCQLSQRLSRHKLQNYDFKLLGKNDKGFMFISSWCLMDKQAVSCCAYNVSVLSSDLLVLAEIFFLAVAAALCQWSQKTWSYAQNQWSPYTRIIPKGFSASKVDREN